MTDDALISLTELFINFILFIVQKIRDKGQKINRTLSKKNM